MSNNYYETDKVILTAFLGPEDNRHGCQLTMNSNDEYAVLNKEEMIELAINLLLRANLYVTATGEESGIKRDQKRVKRERAERTLKSVSEKLDKFEGE